MNRNLVIFLNDEYSKISSLASDISFNSVLIGASELAILEAAGHFDFSAKRLTNLAAPSASGDAATKGYVDGLVGSAGDFLDTAFRVSDDGDNTKKIAMQASGIATSTTRTIIMPDADVTLGHIASLVTLSGVAGGSADLGTFTGAIISDNVTIKAALQELESEIENLPNPMVYQGQWNANTNSPSLANGAGTTGHLYRTSVAGTTDFGAGGIAFDIGDLVVYNGTIWERWDVVDQVVSVNGDTGAVTVNAINELTGDVTAGPASGSASAAATIAALAVTNAKIANDTITNAKISPSAAIVYSKLDLADSIVNADINSAAAIAYSKLALSGSIVNADINASAAIAYSKLALSDSIVNADINSAAAIAYSKLNLSNSIVAGDLTAESVTAAKIAAAAVGEGLKGGNGSAIARDDAKSFTNDNAGSITVRQVVYIKANGAVDLANDATSGLGTKMIGLVEDASIATTASGKVSVRRGAIIPGFTGLTPGAPVYIGSTLGATTQTAPTGSGTAIFSLGMALSATEVEFNPRFIIANV